MRKLFIVFLLQSCLMAYSQMARWVMRPAYEKIYLASGVPVVISDSLGTTALWDFYGNKIASTTDILHTFQDGLAVTTKRGSNQITGFFRANGEFVKLEHYEVAHSYPYFSNGYLLVKRNKRYMFLDKNGKAVDYGMFINMYPFIGGLSAAFTYEQLDKLKNPYYSFVSVDRSPVPFSYKNKLIDKDDVEFLSSLTEDGQAIAIIKGKVFFYDNESRLLKPIMTDEADVTKRRQVEVDGDIEEYLIDEKDSITITARGNKKDIIRFVFDEVCRPVKAVFPRKPIVYKSKEAKQAEYAANLVKIEEAKKIGLKYSGKVILQPQFEDYAFSFNDNAIVKSGGKWGMITYDKDLDFKIKMNKGNDIAFRHQKFETTVRLDLPSKISSKNCHFEIKRKHGCEIDRTSIQSRDTEDGNYVQYNCILTIPDSLPDVLTEVVYPVEISYDGLKIPTYSFTARAWHYKYVNVDLNGAETVVSKGNVAFTVSVTAEKTPGDMDYPLEVSIDAKGLKAEKSKMSESRYKCVLYSLAERTNKFNIVVSEAGCMPSIFPFEITYVKPVQGTRESVTITKMEGEAQSAETALPAEEGTTEPAQGSQEEEIDPSKVLKNVSFGDAPIIEEN